MFDFGNLNLSYNLPSTVFFFWSSELSIPPSVLETFKIKLGQKILKSQNVLGLVLVC